MPPARKKRGSRSAAKTGQILSEVLRFYRSSHDFNGLPTDTLLRNSDRRAVTRSIMRLVVNGSVSVEFGDRHPNPHIKAFDEEPTDTILAKARSRGLSGTCLYPSRRVLAKSVDAAEYATRPFSRALALGEPQLGVRYFDPIVLETYRNDPRFHYKCDDVGGRFAAKWEDSAKGHLERSDEVFIEDFGFAYSDRLDRSVAAFLRYLSRLGPKHQQLWQAHELPASSWKPHPGWWAMAMGEFPRRVSVFNAFLGELRVANEMCEAIGWPPLYREDFATKERPAGLAFLLRPTLGAFNSFVHLLDKMMSENLSLDFFRTQGLSLEGERQGRDGKTRAERRGTISLLEEWLLNVFRAADESPLRRAVEVFREVRAGRQKPAHGIDDDRYDPDFYTQQRALMERAYGTVRVIRLVLACHPGARNVKIPQSLANGDIWFA